jgi:hypothetical protein
MWFGIDGADEPFARWKHFYTSDIIQSHSLVQRVREREREREREKEREREREREREK